MRKVPKFPDYPWDKWILGSFHWMVIWSPLEVKGELALQVPQLPLRHDTAMHPHLFHVRSSDTILSPLPTQSPDFIGK